MFDKQYRFKGRHALRVDQLTGVFDELSKAKLIDRNVDVYANAPLIGFLYGRTADLDDTKNSETGQVYNQNVMGDRVIYSGDELCCLMLIMSPMKKSELIRLSGIMVKILLKKNVLIAT